MFKSAAVIGAGVMGAGIARHLAGHVDEVLLLDISDAQLDKARAAGSGHKITYSNNFDRLANADYIIEAVFEDADVKADVLRRISEIAEKGTVIATNTSSLLVKDLSVAVIEPSRFIGVHYNNPADFNPVVEIIAGPRTREGLDREIRAWLEETGKMAICCADTSGFILNRQSLPYINEAARCLDIATPAEIDQVAVSRLGVGLGPFAVMNLVGLPVMAAASRNLAVLGEGYEPADRLQTQAKAQPSEWKIAEEVAEVEGTRARIIEERLRGAQIFPGMDILNQALCQRDDLNMICKQALGYRESSPELIESLPRAEVKRLVELFLGSSGR